MRKRLFLGLRILLALLVVLFLLTLLASTPKVQNLIAQRLINNLSGRYGLTLSVDAVRVNPLSLNATIQHLFVPDHKGDTLLYVRSLSSRWGSLAAFMGNSSSVQYSLGETYLKVQTHEGDTLSSLAYYLNQLPKGRVGRFEAKSIRAGSVHIDYSDQFEGDAHEFLLRDITLTNLVASNNHIAGRLQFDGVYLKNETIVEPSLRADVTVDTQGSTLMVSELNLRTETDAIALSYLTYNRDSKRLEAVINESFLSGKRLESMGVKGFGNRALYLEGSLSGDSDKLFTDKLSIQWGNSSGMIGGFIGLNKPSLSYEIQFSDIQAQWADLSWLTKTLNSQSSFQPLLSPRTAVKGSLSLSRKPDELLASSSLVIGDSRLEVSFNRVDQQESLQLDIRSFPINWLLKGATQRLSASLEANRKKGYPFEFNANIHRIDFDHGLSLERIIWEALPTGAAYSMAISSEVPGQSFEALFDYEKVKDRYSIEGKVDVNRLNALMSTPDFEALPFSTVASFSLWGSSLSDIQGQLNLDALRFFPPNRSLVEVGSVRMSHTALGQSERQFIVVSEDFVNLQVSGNYHLFDWQQAFSQLKLPRTLQLDADIQTGDRWVELIEGSTVLPEVSVYLRYTDGKLKSDIRLSQFSYDVFDMKQLRAYSNPSEGFVLDAESLLSPYFSLASVHTTIKGNRLELEASTTGAKSDRFLVNSSWNRLSDDQLLIAIDPSRFTLKQYQWVIEKRAEFMIDFNNRSVSLDRLDLKTLDNGYLSIYGGYNGNDNYAISLELENAPIETITPEIKNLSLKGNATGLVQFKKQGKRYEPRFNLSVEDLLVNNKFVGFFNGVVLGSANADIFTLQADVLNSGRATLELSGILNQTENGLFDLDVDARLARFDISPFSELGTTTFSNLRGLASGSISLANTLEQPELVGTLQLEDAGLSFPYLGMDFKIASSPQIRLNGTDFYFDHFKLVDTEFETATEIDGFIYHQGLKNFQFDLNVKTLSEASLVLKTRQREDALYYGTGFVSGAGSVKGNPQNTIITVDAETKQGSSLYIPLISETVDFSDDLVQFTNSMPTSEARVLNPIETQKGVSLDFNLRVTPEALVEVIVDPLSGSRLRGRGTGLFRFQIAPAEEFSIFGEYTVASGAFDYRFGGIIDKGFDLAPGGMITWNGDPYDADINLEAVYSLNANPAPLLDSSSFPRPIQTDVLIQLGGKLLNPVIDFSLRFPTLNSVVRSEIEYRLQDRSTLERNVFFLLAQGNFVNEQMGLSQQALTGNLLQSASGLLEEVLGASEVVDLGLSYEQGYRNPNANVAIEDRIGVTVSTQLGNRLLFNGKLGVPVGRVTETVVAGDVELQLILNEEGTLSAKIFNRENTLSQFLASIPGYTQGLGLSYQVDFNDFKELVRRVLKSSNTTEE